jgi:ligand-binding sensor domain-containing protein
MSKYFIIIIFLQPVFCTVPAQTISNNKETPQRESYQAISWSAEQGLATGSINCMLKDVNGFLWIGTSFGLSRFDGSHFVNYLPDKNKSGTISDTHILSLVEDSLHNIWMGTYKGISRYDLRADTFSNFFSPVDSSVLTPYTLPFYATKNEVFCIEMYSRLAAYNVHTFKRRVIVEHFQNDWSHELLFLLHPAYSILDEHNNCVWMTSKTGLLQVSLTTGKQTNFTFPCTRKAKPNDYILVVASMCYDSKRNIIWVNTSEGLMQFDLAEKKFYHVDEFNKIVNENPPYFMPDEGIGLDLKDRVWMGSRSNGTFIYDPEKHTITQPFITNLHGNVLHQYPAYFGKDGIVWGIGSQLCQLNPIQPVATHYVTDTLNPSSLSDNHVATMVEGPQHKIWMGTWDGISIYDPVTDSFQVLKEKDLPGFHGKNIMPLTMDSLTQTTWLLAGPPSAIFQMDVATKKCTLIKINDTTVNHRFDLDNMEAEPTRPFKNGFIFFMASVGIYSVMKDSLTAQEMIPLRQFIFRMIMVDDHLLFLRTYDGGNSTYVEKNRKWLRTSNVFDSIAWTNIFFDKNDNSFWVGVVKGLMHYNKNFHLIRDYSNEFPGMQVFSMLTDNYGNLWFVNGSSTISRLNIKTGKYLTLTEKDGMPKEYFYREHAHLKDSYGNLYFACANGFYKINPAIVRDKYPPASVYIQSISINQKPFQLPVSANYVQEIFLKHDQNNISFETGTIDYYPGGNNRIRYKLTDVFDNWQYGSDQASLNFNGLPAGQYKLIMQASNAMDEFNGPEKVLLINISPAFWNTLWFRIIAVLCVAAILYVIIRWRINQKFKSRLQRSENEKQLAELKDKATQLEIQTLRSQMNPHFIFNCLSSINRFILKNKTEEASDYLTKFSRLIRMVLNNSKQSFISLEDELETLRLYLEMERLRFKNSFDYNFTYTNSVNLGNIFIPPLLLQPFAENAIWHGLMHKHEKGFLNFDFSVEDKFLSCNITDNGVGRERAELLKSKSVEKQKSMGLKITTERLSLLYNNSNEQTFFTIEDLTDENGNATGTRVHLKIFYKEMMEV